MTAGACYLGVDSGGSKTAFALVDPDGRILAQALRGSSYYVQIGFDELSELMRSGVAEVTTLAGISSEQISHAFFGISAYGEDASVTPRVDSIIASAMNGVRFTCGNDMLCGWAGSLAGEDGVNIVAGTGSIAYGERRGRSSRAGGWGPVLGDEGSGYWLAVQALNLFTKMADGRHPHGALYGMIRDHLRLSGDGEIIALLGGDGILATRGRIAALAPLVTRAALEGDADASAMIARTGHELASIVHAVARRLKFAPGEIVPVSYSGGVFRASDIARNALAEALNNLRSGYDLRDPLMPPLGGAVLMAARCAKRHLDAEAIERLRAALRQ